MAQSSTSAAPFPSPHLLINKWATINHGLTVLDGYDAATKAAAQKAGVKRSKTSTPSHRLLWQTLVLLLVEELNSTYQASPTAYATLLSPAVVGLSFHTNREQLRQMLAKLNKDTVKGSLVSLPTINNLLDRLIDLGLVSKTNNGRKNFKLTLLKTNIIFCSLIKSFQQSDNSLFRTINNVNTSKGCEAVSASQSKDEEIRKSSPSDADNIGKVKIFRSEANLTGSAASDEQNTPQNEDIILRNMLRVRSEKTRKLAALLWAQAKAQLWSERAIPAPRAHYAEEMLHAHLQNVVERFELEYTNRVKNYISTNAKYLAASEKKRTELRILYAKNQPNRSVEEAYILVSNAIEIQRKNAAQKGYTIVEPVTYLTADYGMDKALHYAMRDRLATQRFANRSFNPKAAKSVAHFNAKQLIKRTLLAVTKKLLERGESYPAFCVFEKSYTQLVEWLRGNASLDDSQKSGYLQAMKNQVAHVFANVKAFAKLQNL